MSDDYLKAILSDQSFNKNDPELLALLAAGEEVSALLRDVLGEEPMLSHGGSYAKGTMIRKSYDLDLIFFWPAGDSPTLRDAYGLVRDALFGKFHVTEKRSAITIQKIEQIVGKQTTYKDLHIDVLPGKFTDEDREDAFLYQNPNRQSGPIDEAKSRLKTNPKVQIEHIRDSGFQDEIKLLKLWRSTQFVAGTGPKTFVLELLTIKVLSDCRATGIAERLKTVLEYFCDNAETMSVEDPSNPFGNDLADLLDTGVRLNMKSISNHTLNVVEKHGWETLFGPVRNEENKASSIGILRRAAADPANPARPWCLE